MEKNDTIMRDPIVRDWRLLGYGDVKRHFTIEAAINLIHATRDLNAFMADKAASRLDLQSYAVVLNGSVYGHSGFVDGDQIHTSPIDHISKILPEPTGERMDALSLEDWQGIEPLYCATTMSGSKYHFLKEEINAAMAKLIETVAEPV